MPQKRFLAVQIIGKPWEAKVLVERWRCEYNQTRPHSALGYRPPREYKELADHESQSPALVTGTNSG